MRLLFDTNVFIPGDPLSGEMPPESAAVFELFRRANEGRHQVFRHPAIRYDIERDGNEVRRADRRAIITKYQELVDPPPVPDEWLAEIGTPTKGSNDWVDHQLLAALSRHAADVLVTEDRRLLQKAKRVGLGSRVQRISEAIAALRALSGETADPPPAVRSTRMHALSVESPFFDSLRADYDGPKFDKWLVDSQKKGRSCWLVDGADQQPAAVCIYKDEDEAFGVSGKLLKICTFKVSDEQRGRRLGELLLKTAFLHAAKNRHDAIYVTVLPKHERLMDLFSDFGFVERFMKGPEHVLFKDLRPTGKASLPPLEFHLRHGPPTFSTEVPHNYVVPIEPRFHRLLFPDAETQQELVPGAHPFGNGLRKAYLCRSARKSIEPGAPLLFYRSRDAQYVKVIGVAEESFRSTDPRVIAGYVGKRTVYSFTDIEELCAQGEVLAILFRQAVVLDKPIKINELARAGAVRPPVQSITRMKEEAHPWLRQHLLQSSCFPFGPSSPNH